MRRECFWIKILGILILCSLSLSVWAVPMHITFQGNLTDLYGEVQPGAYEYQMRFSFFTEYKYGNAIWSQQQDVEAIDGFYNVQLGPLPLSLFENEELYLEVEIEDETLSPRQKLISTAFAIKAKNADTLDGKHAHEFGNGHSLNAADGDPNSKVYVDDEGKVGIGTTSPEASFHVAVDSQFDGELGVAGTIHSTSGGIRFPDDTIQTTAATGLSDAEIVAMGYIKSVVEVDPTVDLNKLKSLTSDDFHNLGGTDQKLTDADIGTMGYIKAGDETDPTVDLDKLKSLTSDDFHNLGGTDQKLTDADIGTMGYIKSVVEADPKVGTATINKIPKWDGNQLIDSASIFEDTSGNIGIGTTNPLEQLEVAGNIKVTWGVDTPYLIMGYTDLDQQDDYIRLRTRNTIINELAPLEEEKYMFGGFLYDWPNSPDNPYIDDAFNIITYHEKNLAIVSPATIITGNVGIETTDPWTKLHIGNNIGGGFRSWMDHGIIVCKDSDGVYFGMKDEGTNRKDTVIVWGDDSEDNLRFIFNPNEGPEGNSSEIMCLTATGNVGIGTTTPGAKLEILDDLHGLYHKSIKVYGPNMTTGEREIISLGKDDSNYNAAEFTFYYDGDASTSNRLSFKLYGSPEILHILGTGNVGISTTSPSEKLEVAGTVKATAFVGDGSGLTNISAIADIDWIENGGNIYRSSGNVGIGTASPSEKLEIVGTIKATASNSRPDRKALNIRNDRKSFRKLFNRISVVKVLRDLATNY